MKKLSYEQLFLNQLAIPKRLLTHYNQLSLNEKDVVLILQLYMYIQEGNAFPTPTELAETLAITENECVDHLRHLMQKQVLEIKELRNDRGQLSEAYSLNLLWQKLYVQDKQTKEEKETSLFILLEQEFGRPLSPFEIEIINAWLDEDMLRPALIKAAIREAVLMGKLNFKYIDRILRDWQRKGIRTVEEARVESRSFRSYQVKKERETEKRDTSVYFNWIEGGDE